MSDNRIVAPEQHESVPQQQQGLELNRFVDDLRGRPEAQVGAIVNSELVRKNIDTIANIAGVLPDAMFPIDSTKMPMLHALGIEKIEKHGSTYTVTQDHGEQMPVHQPPVDHIEIGKTFSFQIGHNPQTGMATFDHIQGVSVHANVLGSDIAVPVQKIEHNKQGQAKFCVDSGLPYGMPGSIKVDVALEPSGKVDVTHPRVNVGGQQIDLGSLMGAMQGSAGLAAFLPSLDLV
ncbi:MAG TPA: hypothetical protein V6C81_31460 [Planktothrix sp.]|jgi:hypothetical protein